MGRDKISHLFKLKIVNKRSGGLFKGGSSFFHCVVLFHRGIKQVSHRGFHIKFVKF